MFWCTCASLRNKKDKVCQAVGKLSVPPQAGGDLATLGKYAGKAGKKAAEMGRFFLSEWLREPETQKMLIGKAERIAKPFLKKGIDQISTKSKAKQKIFDKSKRFGCVASWDAGSRLYQSI